MIKFFRKFLTRDIKTTPYRSIYTYLPVFRVFLKSGFIMILNIDVVNDSFCRSKCSELADRVSDLRLRVPCLLCQLTEALDEDNTYPSPEHRSRSDLMRSRSDAVRSLSAYEDAITFLERAKACLSEIDGSFTMAEIVRIKLLRSLEATVYSASVLVDRAESLYEHAQESSR
jgi:hypothetical protein